MIALDATDPAALEAVLDALPEGTWIEVETEGETFLVQRVPGGWVLPGDVVIASGDVADGRPERVEVLGDDGRLPPEQAIAEARAVFERGDRDGCESALVEIDDLDAVGWAEAGALRAEVARWLAGWSSC